MVHIATSDSYARRDTKGGSVSTPPPSLDVLIPHFHSSNFAVYASIRSWRAGSGVHQIVYRGSSACICCLTCMLMSIQDGKKYARDLFAVLESKLREEDVRRNTKARDRFAALR